MKKMNKSRVQNVVGFVQKAPVNGRSYTDMLKHVVKSEFQDTYDYKTTDRGLLGYDYISALEENGVMKEDFSGRYFFVG